MLGAAWNVINPLAMIIVYTVIFSQIMRARLVGVDGTFGYSIYLCSGILTWGLFSEIVSRNQSIFIDNSNLLKKINFPRLCLPLTVFFTALLNFSIIFGLFILFLIISGNFPGTVFLAMIPILLIMVLFATGLGITLGVLNVFFRDIGQLFGLVLQFWFWGTPIIYPTDILPERIRTIIELNPMTSVIGACQSVLVRGEWPSWGSLLPVLFLGLIFCILGIHLYRKHSGEIVDEL
jgi:lipopolysaccharide transport system permease protein